MSRKMDVDKINLSLNGCGYLGIYHVGVCACIKQYHPQILTKQISGGSVGALVACAFMCEVPLSMCVKYISDVSMEVRNGILGPMSPNLNIMRLLKDRMGMMIPPDPHLYCDGKLNVSVTRYDTGQNVLLKDFKSREELLQALMCSCFIPVYCGYDPPLIHGVAYVDAALSNNSPCLNEHTVTVAPFSGNSDICPENDGLLLFPKALRLSNTSIGVTSKNVYMLFRVLFPGTPDILKEFCHKGYNDALRFLRDNDLVPCPNCVTKKRDHSKCGPIEQQLPKEMADEFDSSIQEFQKNLRYRLFQYRSMKFLYYMNIPSIFTAKVAYAAISMVLQKVQSKAGFCVDDIWKHFLQILRECVHQSNGPNQRPIENCVKDQKSDAEAETSENNWEFSVCNKNGWDHPASTDVEINVPETDLTYFVHHTCAIDTTLNKSYKLDLPLCNSKTELAEVL